MSPSKRVPLAVDDAARFEANLVEFVRSFGLLQPDRTPCGQPLHVSQAHALAIIAGNPGIGQHDLTVALGLARATVSEMVSELCARGWVTRERAATDRRVQRLDLTTSGRTIAQQAAEARRALMIGVLDALEPDERATVTDALGRLSVSARVAVARASSTNDTRDRERAV
jgi:DNA-binding MarR family transcriptional regulator